MNRKLLKQFKASQGETERLREEVASEILREVKSFCAEYGLYFRVCNTDFAKSGFYRKSPHYLIDDTRINTYRARRIVKDMVDCGVLRGVPVWQDTTSELQWIGHGEMKLPTSEHA